MRKFGEGNVAPKPKMTAATATKPTPKKTHVPEPAHAKSSIKCTNPGTALAALENKVTAKPKRPRATKPMKSVAATEPKPVLKPVLDANVSIYLSSWYTSRFQ